MNKLESFKLITLEEFKNWEGFDKLVAQYGKKLYDDTISNYLIEGITRASLQLDSICGYRLETEFPLLDPNSEIDKKRINYVKIACCLQTQYLIRTGIEYSTGGESSSDGITSYTYPTNMKIEFSPDIISLLEKAKFYKSQTLTKINPDNYGFTNQYNNGFGKYDTNHKDRPIMLSEADAKYVWKKSMFTSNTLSIIPWSSTEKSGIWQIEISQQLLGNFINNYIKNISIKLNNKSIVYNSNNELSVPFDNDTIYYEDNVWKAKESEPVEVNVPLFVDEDDGSIGLLISDDFDIEEDKLSLSKDWELKFTVEVVQKILEGIGKKLIWESVPIPSFTTDSVKFIDIPEFSEKYRYQVWLSPTIRKGAEGMLWLEPPYFSSKHQATCFIDDMDKTPYSITLYNSGGRVYLTNGSDGSNILINSVRILRQEV
ncbi:hypothetical protein SKUN_00339 [Spiroplasma kunkelii CR2-3x]|uniref:Uncharacterized protein n=1 Tax=Spiroplasma kunkelii CR2-3x TaxID=273035 RepID=A0A0K2JFB0_SPIKU|nr:hypothetical protein [Spiroplasma kunkelii]ALA97255.1 hypothetical protein SKUN_00339 [Spiroplasma kunkelii CR2-3x]